MKKSRRSEAKKLKAVCVSGTPGTGKTALAKKIAKRYGFKYVDVNKVISKEGLGEGYDRKRKSKIVDEKKLAKKLAGMIRVSAETLVIDSHLAHYVPGRYVDVCIVTRADLKPLYRRLQKRGYSKAKISENMEAEILDVIPLEALKFRHHVINIYTAHKGILQRFFADFDKLIKGKSALKELYKKG